MAKKVPLTALLAAAAAKAKFLEHEPGDAAPLFDFALMFEQPEDAVLLESPGFPFRHCIVIAGKMINKYEGLTFLRRWHI